jgi:ubiquinone/menaquinone biosynthesis C-methylase UbiE
MHENSILLFRNHALPCFAAGMKVLEIGPDAFPSTYQRQVTVPNLTWDTLDIFDSPKLTYPKCDVYHFPIPDNHYDIVCSGQVIEHVGKIWRWMAELARITKPGGLVITINPVSWPYHQAPIDCWRIYPEGMKALSEDSGLVVEKSFWGSLESPQIRRHILPGRSLQHQPKIHKFLSPILNRLGGRVEKSFDNITVARKPLPPRQP